MEQKYNLANTECDGINARVLVQNFKNASIIHKTDMSMNRVYTHLVTLFFFFLIIFWLIWLCNCIKQRPKEELVKEPDGDEARRRRRKWWSEDLALSSSSKTKIPQPDHWSIPTTVKIGVIINRDSASVVVEWCESQCSWTRTCTTYHVFFLNEKWANC